MIGFKLCPRICTGAAAQKRVPSMSYGSPALEGICMKEMLSAYNTTWGRGIGGVINLHSLFPLIAFKPMPSTLLLHL